MSKLKIDKNIYVGDTGYTLEQIKNNAANINTNKTNINTNKTNISNLSNRIGAAMIVNDGDFIQYCSNAWNPIVLAFDHMIYNSNSSLFQYHDRGIKILKDGYYLISGTINWQTSITTTTLVGGFVLRINDNYVFITDVLGRGMINSTMPPRLVYLKAGDIVRGAFRTEETNVSLLFRGARSGLTIQAC